MAEKTDPVLFQLPPSLSFDLAIAEDFFSLLRKFYDSNCEEDFLTALASRIKALDNVWVVFDNTALSHAYSNALRLQTLIGVLPYTAGFLREVRQS
jgi:uncharacterized protein YecE (DUF72 family)